MVSSIVSACMLKFLTQTRTIPQTFEPGGMSKCDLIKKVIYIHTYIHTYMYVFNMYIRRVVTYIQKTYI